MFSSRFGIEIELTGITRTRAAEIAAEYLGGSISITGDFYGTHHINTPDGRIWKFMSDGSITCQRKENRQIVSAGNDYSVELVSPILTYYEDIEAVQELVRRLRRVGGFVNKSCGICLLYTSPSPRD